MEYLKTHDVKDTDTMLKVLVVGGGDGYVVNELVKYSKIGVIEHVELDEEVINVSKKYLPWGEAWNDSRVNLIIEDGAKFVKEQVESGHKYDVVSVFLLLLKATDLMKIMKMILMPLSTGKRMMILHYHQLRSDRARRERQRRIFGTSLH